MNSQSVLKIVVIVAVLAGLGGTAAALTFYRDARDQAQRVTDFNRQLELLLKELDNGIAQRQALEAQIKTLAEDKSRADSQARELTSELESTRSLIDPDYQAVEQRIRRQVTEEFQRREEQLLAEQQRRASNRGTAALVAELSQLDAAERMAVFSVQGQYGEFLNRLEADPERKEMITQALVDLNLEQAQARENLLAQEQMNPREVRRELAAIMSPEAVREQLSYYLNEDELALLAEVQPQSMSIRVGRSGDRAAFFAPGDPGTAGGVFSGGDIFVQPLENGQEGRLMIRRIESDN